MDTYYNCNLNIHYTMPDELFDKIGKLYEEMPYYVGIIEATGVPTWYNVDNKIIVVSVEPSGLQFYCEGLSEEEWTNWIELFKKRATEILGYSIGEPEDGFEFKYWL